MHFQETEAQEISRGDETGDGCSHGVERNHSRREYLVHPDHEKTAHLGVMFECEFGKAEKTTGMFQVCLAESPGMAPPQQKARRRSIYRILAFVGAEPYRNRSRSTAMRYRTRERERVKPREGCPGRAGKACSILQRRVQNTPFWHPVSESTREQPENEKPPYFITMLLLLFQGAYL